MLFDVLTCLNVFLFCFFNCFVCLVLEKFPQNFCLFFLRHFLFSSSLNNFIDKFCQVCSLKFYAGITKSNSDIITGLKKNNKNFQSNFGKAT